MTDFAVDLPDGEAPLWFRVFERAPGGEVLVFASGNAKAGEPSIFGFVTIARKSADVRGDRQPGTPPQQPWRTARRWHLYEKLSSTRCT